MEAKEFAILKGSKLEYSSTQNGTYTRLYGFTVIPAVGETPNEVDTTSHDNKEYESFQYGLKPAPKFEIELNLQTPEAEANINLVHNLKTSGNVYYWKLTRGGSNITHTFASKVDYGFNEGAPGELDKFTLFLAPIGEPTTDIPTGSGV